MPGTTTLALPTSNHAPLPQQLPVAEWLDAMKRAAGGDGDPNTRRTELNALVMNFLLVSGLSHVAEAFAAESATHPSVPLESIEQRSEIRALVTRGDIDAALAAIDRHTPGLFAAQPSLHLALKQQKLIELIRAGEVAGAVQYARDALRTESAASSECLHQMEAIMSLLAFSALPPEHNPMRHLLAHERRVDLAGKVNSAILHHQFAASESHLESRIKHLDYAQHALERFIPKFPRIDCCAIVREPLAPAKEGASQPPSLFSLAAPLASAAAAASASSSSAVSMLLDPSPMFESLAAAEAVERRHREAAAARDASTSSALLQRQLRLAQRAATSQARRRREAAGQYTVPMPQQLDASSSEEDEPPHYHMPYGQEEEDPEEASSIEYDEEEEAGEDEEGAEEEEDEAAFHHAVQMGLLRPHQPGEESEEDEEDQPMV